MPLTRISACKVNLVLNILDRRADGFHDLETLFQPVPLHDEISAEMASGGIHLTCSNPALACDASNLVWRAAESFLKAARLNAGVRLHLRKNLPIAAGLGAGSANAATTLVLLNELFGLPLGSGQLNQIAASLGSDVNFFLQPCPATAVGRGEQITPLTPFTLLRGRALLLFRPGFGVATPWAFRELSRHPGLLPGRTGLVSEAVSRFAGNDLIAACACLFNSLELPVLGKYPILRIYQDFLRKHGAVGTLMSGSGSTTFALFGDLPEANRAAEQFRQRFGDEGWLGVVTL